MVVNAPTSNIISAAELTVGHILSLARFIPAAHESLAAGTWKRSKFTGTELFEKTIGIIGLGRIGALITARLQAFGMNVVAYDPYVTAARAQQLGVTLLSLDELLKTSDFITIHMPKTPETTGMISTDQLALMKPTAFIVNVARGGLIDEDALYAALKSKRIAGAGLDVFVNEPPTDSPLLALDNIVLTPHLGASTDEAQEKAGVSVARSVRLALDGELVPDAVNVAGGVIDPTVRPGIPLIEKLGQVFAGLAASPLTSVDIEVRGEIVEFDVSVLKLAALKGIFSNIVSESVSYVNAPLLAEQRGMAVRLVTDPVSEEYRNLLTIRGLAQRRLADLGLGHARRNQADREARRDQRLRRRGSARRAPHRDDLQGPPRNRRHLRQGVRRGIHQHRRNADRAHHGGRPGAQRADGRFARSRGAAREAARRDRRVAPARDRHRRLTPRLMWARRKKSGRDVEKREYRSSRG